MSTRISFPTLLVCICLFGSCAEKVKAPETPTAATPMVGADQDAHGCKPSTGYQWSEIKGTCIRIFETGIRLDAKGEGVDTTLSAFIVFKTDEDDAKVELFMPNDKSSHMLDSVKDNGAGTWKSAKYKLTQWKGMYTLDDASGKTLYQGSMVK